MAFDWGGFAGGFARGLEPGYRLGKAIAQDMRASRFEDSINQAKSDEKEALQALNDEQWRRNNPEEAKARAQEEDSAVGSLKETNFASTPLATTVDPNGAATDPKSLRFGGEAIRLKNETPMFDGKPVSTDSLHWDAQAISQGVAPQAQQGDFAISPDLAHTQANPLYSRGQYSGGALAEPTGRITGRMSQAEMDWRKQSILRDRRRSILEASAQFYARDPEKLLSIEKELYSMSSDDYIRDIIGKALKGDTSAIGIMAKTVLESDYGKQNFPDGAFRMGNDGLVEFYNAKTGEVYYHGEFDRELVMQGAPLFARSAKALLESNWDKMHAINMEKRQQRREDAEDKRKEDELNLKYDALTESAYGHDLQAYGLTQKGTPGLPTGIPAGAERYETTDDAGNKTVYVKSKKNGQLFGTFDDASGTVNPLHPKTKEESAVEESFVKQGWRTATLQDDNGVYRYGVVNPETGEYRFLMAPDRVYRDKPEMGIQIPQRVRRYTRDGVNLSGGRQAIPLKKPQPPKEGALRQTSTKNVAGSSVPSKESKGGEAKNSDKKNKPAAAVKMPTGKEVRQRLEAVDGAGVSPFARGAFDTYEDYRRKQLERNIYNEENE